MVWEKRVVWTEGMMLQPQHFQQQTRYHEGQLRLAINECFPENWGLTELDIDQALLKTGKLCVRSAQGILRDGSPFHFPHRDNAPSMLNIDSSQLNARVYLALPLQHHGATELNREVSASARYAICEHEIRDVSGNTEQKTLVEMSGLNFSLRTSLQDNSEFMCLAIAKIDDVSPNGVVSLDPQFIPDVSNAKTSIVLSHFLSELLNLQQHRIQSIASRLSVAGKSSHSEIIDFMMLQTLNRYLPLLRQLHHCEHIKPYALYEVLVSLIGEMSTFIQADKMVPELPYYLHSKLSSVFHPLMQVLRELFSVVLEQNAVSIALEERKFGIRVGTIADKSLFTHASFILAVGADVSPDELRKHVPGQIKIGAVESIKELVNLQLPGIQINHLPAAPRDIPYQRHCVYFELVQAGEYWQSLSVSGGIACHLSQSFPNLTLELWAIRN